MELTLFTVPLGLSLSNHKADELKFLEWALLPCFKSLDAPNPLAGFRLTNFLLFIVNDWISYHLICESRPPQGQVPAAQSFSAWCLVGWFCTRISHWLSDGPLCDVCQSICCIVKADWSPFEFNINWMTNASFDSIRWSAASFLLLIATKICQDLTTNSNWRSPVTFAQVYFSSGKWR